MFSNIGQVETFANNHPVLVFVLLIWSLVWKALALWKAARIGHKNWFVVLLILNLFGIPEMIYLYFVARKFKVESEIAT